eukprot:2719570-Prymnesium_polylepis.2
MHDLAAAACFRRTLLAGVGFARHAEAGVPLDISHEGISTVVRVGRHAVRGGKVEVMELGKWVVL